MSFILTGESIGPQTVHGKVITNEQKSRCPNLRLESTESKFITMLLAPALRGAQRFGDTSPHYSLCQMFKLPIALGYTVDNNNVKVSNTTIFHCSQSAINCTSETFNPVYLSCELNDKVC